MARARARLTPIYDETIDPAISNTTAMQFRHLAVQLRFAAWRNGLLWPVLLAVFVAGCTEEPRARSYMEFMDDSYAREGTLARCNRDREATARDVECVNARRAAQMIAAQADEALREQREAESEALLLAARERTAREQRARAQAEAAAKAEQEAQYEAQWSGSNPAERADPASPAASRTATYDSLAATLGVVGPPRPAVTAHSPEPAPAVDVTIDTEPQPAWPALERVEVPAAVAPALPYVELPAPPAAPAQ